jgi:Glucose / Sorbosone dehydrogenase
MGRLRIAAGLAALILALLAVPARAATLSEIGSFDQPIYVTSDPGNPNRLFVAEREGTIVERVGGTSTPFADISSLVGCAGSCVGERGLLSIAMAPDFNTSGRFYVDYAENSAPGTIHVAELQTVGGTALGQTPKDLLPIPHSADSSHNGGQVQIGPEGDLFISTGDGGGVNDEGHNAQSLESLLGKILRIRPGAVGSGDYSVPTDNPFAAAPEPYDTIWSYGLRNPFRFSFDRGLGTLTIGDVGQAAREEVDFAAAPTRGAGANFGWNCREGMIPGPATDEGCDAPLSSFTAPVFDYSHANLTNGAAHGCAIIGGYVARGPNLGELGGRYVYGDWCFNQIRSFCPAAPAASDRFESIAVGSLNSFGEDSAGRLYAVSGAGPVYRLAAGGTATCETGALPPPSQGAEPKPSFVGIQALRAKVPKNRRTMVTAWVSPCEGRRGQPVTLWQGPRRIGVRHLDRVCTVRFRPKIQRLTRFRATVREDAAYQGAISRRLTIRIDHRPRHRRKHRSRLLSSLDSASGWAKAPSTR